MSTFRKLILKMTWLKNIFKVCRLEMKKMVTDTGPLLFFIIVPLLYPLLYSYLYNGEVVREVPVVCVDDCRSSQSREFLRKADATPDLHIVSYCSDMKEAQDIIDKHDAYGLIYIPDEFSKDLAEGRQTTINLYCDMSGLLYYKSLLSGCTLVSLDMNKDIKMERLSGLSDREKDVMVQPIENEYITIFNPQNGFGSFLIPAVLILLLQQTLVLGISMMAGTERERRARGELVLDESFASPMDVLAGKGLAYLFIYLCVSAYVLCIVPLLFDMPMIWRSRELQVFIIPFLLSAIFFAITLSFIVKDRESCFLLFVFASVPLLFLSGISWPVSNMPKFWKWFSYLFPSTWGINGFVKIACMGATLSQVKQEFLALWLQTGVYFMLSLLIYIRLYRSDHMPELEALRGKLSAKAREIKAEALEKRAELREDVLQKRDELKRKFNR